MKEINEKIINDVRKSLESELSEDVKDNDVKNKNDLDLLSISKIKDLDDLIEKKVRDWIKNNAEEVSKKIIENVVKKLFKG